jgi:hypothetical protein
MERVRIDRRDTGSCGKHDSWRCDASVDIIVDGHWYWVQARGRSEDEALRLLSAAVCQGIQCTQDTACRVLAEISAKRAALANGGREDEPDDKARTG